MTTPDTTPRLERLWDELPVGHAPVEDLVRGDRRVHRRRRAFAALGTAAAVAVVAVGVAAGGVLIDGAGNAPRDLVASAPVAPDGQRLVGTGGVVVAVPEDWTPGQGIGGCLAMDAPLPAGLKPTGPVAACPTNGDEHPYVAAAPLNSPVGEFARSYATAPREIGGLEVLVGQGECPRTATCVSTPYPTYVAVPSQNVVLAVFGPKREQDTLDAIVDSVQVLPEGYTAVPSVDRLPVSEAQQVLETAGFSVELTTPSCGPTERCDRSRLGQALGTAPEAGSVVSLGSAITLLGG